MNFENFGEYQPPKIKDSNHKLCALVTWSHAPVLIRCNHGEDTRNEGGISIPCCESSHRRSRTQFTVACKGGSGYAQEVFVVTTDKQLLFISSQKLEEGKAIRGAFLLTDMDAKPLEFRCTNPIRPSSLQNILYGRMLQRHIMVELIGVPLMNSLKQLPSVVLVRDETSFGSDRNRNAYCSACKKSCVPIDTAGGRTPMLSSTSGKFAPLVLAEHEWHAGDIGSVTPFLRMRSIASI